MTIAFACSMAGNSSFTDGDGFPEPGDTDTDTDTDTDADSDTDTDTDAVGPGVGDLAITEIMKNPAAVDDDYGEWFEVANLSGHALRLDGMQGLDEEGDGFTVDTWTLEAGDRVVFGASTDAAVNGGAPVDLGYDVETFRLGNGNGVITLVFEGATLDAVAYDDTFPDEEGRSMSLSPDAEEWCSASSVYGTGDRGTPGGPNDTCTAETDDADGDGTEDALDCEPENPSAYPGGTEAEDGVDNDCDGFVDEHPPTLGDLVVTEIMKNPDPTDDETGEWFEVINASGGALELDGLTVVDAGGTGFVVTTYDVLVAGQFYLFAVSADPALNDGITPDYVYAISDLQLGNGDDEVQLTWGGVLIDAVEYTDDDFPDDAGKSLSLDPVGTSATRNDDPAYWCEGDGQYGMDGNQGTPGAINDPC